MHCKEYICIMYDNCCSRCLKVGSTLFITPDKNDLFRKSNTRDNKLRHENGCVKSSSQLRGEHCKCSPDFFPSECPGLCQT